MKYMARINSFDAVFQLESTLTLKSISVRLIFFMPLFRMGAHYREESDAGATSSNEQKFKVLQIIMHGNYDSNTMHNDVAVLKLDRPAHLDR